MFPWVDVSKSGTPMGFIGIFEFSVQKSSSPCRRGVEMRNYTIQQYEANRYANFQQADARVSNVGYNRSLATGDQRLATGEAIGNWRLATGD